MNYQNRIVNNEMTEQELDEVSGGTSRQALLFQQEKLRLAQAQAATNNQWKSAQEKYNTALNAANQSLVNGIINVTFYL